VACSPSLERGQYRDEDALGDGCGLSAVGTSSRTPEIGKTVMSAIRNPSGGPMSAAHTSARTDTLESDGRASHRPARRLSTETKASFKTTEFFAYLAVLVGVLIAAGMVDEANGGGFGAKQAWLYATILTVGYMISRGLAKSGSREPYTDDRS
jgi:hypothetical protein